MNDQNNDDALLTYYRNRASNLEFEFLQFQVEASKRIEELEKALADATAQPGDSAEQSD